MAKLSQFLTMLKQEVANHSIYVWGAQGQTGSTITEAWIRLRERGHKPEVAVNLWKKQVAAGYGNILKAFDCSGLGIWILQSLGLYNYDNSAHGMMNWCKLIPISEARAGCWVFKTTNGHATHIGYVVDNQQHVIEASRNHGVINLSIMKNGKYRWDKCGIPPFFEKEIGIEVGDVPSIPPVSPGETSSYTYILSGLLQVIKDVNPYIISVDRNVNLNNINFVKLKEAGVVGVVIEGGKLFDIIHLEMSQYVNPYLESMIEMITNNGLAYALYFDVRARNKKEALREIQHMTSCIQVYSSQIGIWLKLNLTQNKIINDEILDLYQQKLIGLGYKNKIGLYATPEQITKISWDQKMNDWYLWLIAPVKEQLELDDEYPPDFFTLDNEV